MNKDIDMRLIYEWNTKRSKLEFAIKECEFQLANARKRLDELENDFKFYIGSLVVPIIICIILSTLINLLYSQESIGNYIVAVVLDFFQVTLFCLYIILLPCNVYYLIKTKIMLNLNKEHESTTVTPPPIVGSIHGYKALEEPSFRSEYNKLTYVLTRYYSYIEKMDNLLKLIKSPFYDMTIEELKAELNTIPFYESIAPSNTFSSNMSRKAHRKALLLLMGIVILVILIVMGLFQ
ncbi:MAG: hypothetical protein E7292_02645 [Lachnospiraceae bacterium]|nr:hypothetical protein [Lachnospiraceae bacterium]